MKKESEIVKLARKLCQIAQEEEVYGKNFQAEESWFDSPEKFLLPWVMKLDEEIQASREKKKSLLPLSKEELEIVEEISKRY